MPSTGSSRMRRRWGQRGPDDALRFGGDRPDDERDRRLRHRRDHRAGSGLKHKAMRTVVAIIAGLFALGALALAVLRCFPPAGMLALWALIFLVGLLIERWR